MAAQGWSKQHFALTCCHREKQGEGCREINWQLNDTPCVDDKKHLVAQEEVGSEGLCNESLMTIHKRFSVRRSTRLGSFCPGESALSLSLTSQRRRDRRCGMRARNYPEMCRGPVSGHTQAEDDGCRGSGGHASGAVGGRKIQKNSRFRVFVLGLGLNPADFE